MHPKSFSKTKSFATRIIVKDPQLVYLRSFEMNRQQTYRGSRFYNEWMRPQGRHLYRKLADMCEKLNIC